MMSQKTERKAELDYAKGLGILFMLMGHIQFSEILNQYVYSFHMPLFFAISGYLYRDNTDGFVSIIKKHALNLMIPFFSFGVIFTGLFIALGHEMCISNILACFISPNHMPFDWCGSIWFLMAIFWVKIVFNIFNKYCNPIGFTALSVSIIIVGIVVALCKVELILCIDSAMIGFLFYYIGYCYKKHESKINLLCSRTPNWLVLVSLALLSLLGMLNTPINMRENVYGNFPLFVISALAGTLFWIYLLKISKSHIPERLLRILKFFNNYSISYMGFNQFIIAIFNVTVLARVNNAMISVIAKLVELLAVGISIAAMSLVIDKSRLRFFIGKR